MRTRHKQSRLLVGVVTLVASALVLFVLLLGFSFLKFDSRGSAQNASVSFTSAPVVGGLSQPTSMTFAPDGRLFVLEQQGRVRSIEDWTLQGTVFWTTPVTLGSERGLLGITLDPNFSSNRYIYLYYTRATQPVKNRVVRITASAGNPRVAETGSEVILLDDIASDAGNHNGGSLHVGPDGKLYVAVGDGGSRSQNSQDLSNLSGKILRINLDGSIPTDNPFYGQSGARGEIWAYGLRNPYTFAFDRLETNLFMFINDVGASTYEEINVGGRGANYGWPTCEGSCNNAAFTNPIYQYGRSVGQAITGGVFYRGATDWGTFVQGDYFFADYVSDWVKRYDRETGAVSNVASNLSSPVDVDLGPDGSIYYLSYQGTVGKIIGQIISVTPTTAVQPTNTPIVLPTPTRTPTPTNPPAGGPTPTDVQPTATPTPTPYFEPTATPTPSVVLPEPPSWFALLPAPLRNFLELLYVWVYIFLRGNENAQLLEGVFPTPTPSSALRM